MELFAIGGAGGGGISSMLGVVTGLMGTMMQAQAANAQAVAAQRAAEARNTAAQYEAAQLDIRAKEEAAAAQRTALQHQRRRELALSTLNARSAASGFSATDPTVLQIGDEIERYGTIQSGLAQYGGQSRAEGVRGQAAGRRYEGEAALVGGQAAAAGYRASGMASMLSGISSLASRFGPGGGGGYSSSVSYFYG